MATKKLRYKILIPVLAQAEDFARLLNQCPDKSKLILVNNLDNTMVQTLCSQAFAKGARVVSRRDNAGCAASWNIGLRELQRGEMDYLIILSPSCNWYNNVGDFVEAIEAQEAKHSEDFYICESDNHITDTHAFAITRRGVDLIGLFDENFHPVYFEDTDYCYRQKLLGSSRFVIRGLRTSAPLNGGVKKDPRVWWQYQHSAQRIHDYYVEKWGGEPGQERYPTPFHEQFGRLDWWVLRKDELVPLPSLEDINARTD